MATISTALTMWEEFVELPDPEDGEHYELHDGEVVLVAPPKPVHLFVQIRLAKWLSTVAGETGYGAQKFPYRPARNLQFWYADAAYLPIEDLESMRTNEYPLYSPPLIVEVLSPSNRPKKVQRQRIAAFAAGTREFWVIDPVARTIEVSLPGATSLIYTIDEHVPIGVLPGLQLPVRILFD